MRIYRAVDYCFWLLLLATPAFAQPAAGITADEARGYFKVLQAVNNTKYQGRNLYAELKAAFGSQQSYTPEQIAYILDQHAFDQKVSFKPAMPTGRSLPVPSGALPAAEVQQHFKVLEEQDAVQHNKAAFDHKAILEQMFGKQPWYTADEIRQVDNSQGKPEISSAVPTVKTKQLEDQKEQYAETNLFAVGLGGFKIRKDWSDVVASEDPSQVGTTKKTTADLEGALISYSHDEAAKPYQGSTIANTWSAMGALIYPITFNNPAIFGSWSPEYLMLAPSVSLNKVSTENPSNEVDHIEFRVGGAGTWMIRETWLNEIQLRGAFVYDTDTAFKAALPAGELDIEPRFLWTTHEDAQAPWKQTFYGIGYRNILWGRIPSKEDGSDNSLVDLQLRTWLHLEAGDLQLNGAQWQSINGSFFRMGPTIQASLNFPQIWNGFSINGEYDYLPALSGPAGKDYYVSLGGALTLYQNAVTHQKVSLVATYKEGGLTLSKQPLNIVTVGLGVIF